MPRHREIAEFEGDPELLFDAVRGALGRLGWWAHPTPDGIHADEDFTRLHCRIQPSRLDIALSEVEDHRTAMLISGSAPGIGPFPPPRRLQRQIAALVDRVSRELSERRPGL